ncbi:hypothetical protein RHSIM_RhsimUnG0163600 [Rhododendron simsii]|uniref:Uncharacterized protein n=1 Tax=Rhododendron simsii TaxID=118357 RepID=A0A834L4F0_RHOSS|nr:hypothetical protein RHSIM_RhsimUnG0163600 [Rhododendron simsii]
MPWTAPRALLRDCRARSPETAMGGDGGRNGEVRPYEMAEAQYQKAKISVCDTSGIPASVQQALNSTGIALNHVPAATTLGMDLVEKARLGPASGGFLSLRLVKK